MTDTTAVAAKLNSRLEQLIHRDEALTKHLQGQDGRLDADFSDRVAFTEMDEVIEQLDDNTREEILAIRSALQRLQNGTYGECVSCGEQIATKRLEILPHTPHCVNCA